MQSGKPEKKMAFFPGNQRKIMLTRGEDLSYNKKPQGNRREKNRREGAETGWR